MVKFQEKDIQNPKALIGYLQINYAIKIKNLNLLTMEYLLMIVFKEILVIVGSLVHFLF